MPVVEHPEPLHAVYTRACLAPVRRRLESGRLWLADVFEGARTRYVCREEVARHDPELLSFFNLNTPEALARARLLLRRDTGRGASVRVIR